MQNEYRHTYHGAADMHTAALELHPGIAAFGTPDVQWHLRAVGEATYFEEFARGLVRLVRDGRRVGSVDPHTVRDLRIYLRLRRVWRDEARRSDPLTSTRE
jgi:hypothetical protein